MATGLVLGTVLLAPTAAAAGPPGDTPAGTGGGCQANGRAIAGVAGGPGAFGQIVRTNAPIADENAAFFTLLCH